MLLWTIGISTNIFHGLDNSHDWVLAANTTYEMYTSMLHLHPRRMPQINMGPLNYMAGQ